MPGSLCTGNVIFFAVVLEPEILQPDCTSHVVPISDGIEVHAVTTRIAPGNCSAVLVSDPARFVPVTIYSIEASSWMLLQAWTTSLPLPSRTFSHSPTLVCSALCR